MLAILSLGLGVVTGEFIDYNGSIDSGERSSALSKQYCKCQCRYKLLNSINPRKKVCSIKKTRFYIIMQKIKNP